MRKFIYVTFGIICSLVLSSSAVGYAEPENDCFKFGCPQGMVCLNGLCEAVDENDESFIVKIFGCNGGDYQCFKGEISIKGVTFSGTWYRR